MLGIVAMLTSCIKDETSFSDSDTLGQVSFSLSIERQVQTRSSADALRYVLSIYDETGEEEFMPATEYSSNSFAVRLKPGKYTCLFWADYGNTNYDVSNMKTVELKESATDIEAYFACQEITVTNGGVIDVTLGRAVAKVILNETDHLEPGEIDVTHDGFRGFDVSKGKGINFSALRQTLPITSAIEGSITEPKTAGSFFMLASKDEQTLCNFTVQYNNESEKSISNVPVRANYVTNINGKFGEKVVQSFTVNIDEKWAGIFQ